MARIGRIFLLRNEKKNQNCVGKSLDNTEFHFFNDPSDGAGYGPPSIDGEAKVDVALFLFV